MRLKAVTRSSLVPMFAVLVFSGSARAQAPGGNKIAAEALFEDARKLAAEGKYTEACPKFADSERLDPSPSTLLNLANCWEKLGRTATAWATYREAESAAYASKRQDYMATAQRHADALAPKVARLTIRVEQPIVGMQVTRDGVVVGSAEWGAAIPVDRGSHGIEAIAPGYKDWAIKVDVANDGAQVSTTVPALEATPAEPSSPPPPSSSTAIAPTSAVAPAPPDHAGGDKPQRTIGVVVGAVGVAGFGVSGVLALLAVGKKDDSMRFCPAPNSCYATGVQERNDALSLGDTAAWAFGIGAAALVTGVVVWLSAPSGATAQSTRAARVVVAPGVGGAVVAGTW
jgi:hypothetical protein